MNLGMRIKYMRGKRGISQLQLAKASNTSQQFINKIENRDDLFETASILRLAKALSVAPRWLAYGEGYYLDEGFSSVGYAPLLPESGIMGWVTNELNCLEKVIEGPFIINPIPQDEDNYRIFAYRINDDSMTSPHPSITCRKDSLVLFKPIPEVSSGNFVLAKTIKEETFVFRQLIKDVDKLYLKPLNPAYRTLDAQDFHVVACALSVVDALR